MEILVCIKRVPAVGGKVVLDPTGAEVDTKFLGFTMSPHEECALEEAVRLVEAHGGSSTVLTLRPAEAEAQLRYAMSLGVARGILLENEGTELGPQVTARRIAEAVRAQAAGGTDFDLLLFGTEAPDTGDFQVGIRVAEHLGLPCVTGIKELSVSDGVLVAQTGTRIFPELYIACGISGAIQHMVGCKGARHILAINRDPDAPIMSKADYTVVGDLHAVLPALVAEVRKAQAAAARTR